MWSFCHFCVWSIINHHQNETSTIKPKPNNIKNVSSVKHGSNCKWGNYQWVTRKTRESCWKYCCWQFFVVWISYQKLDCLAFVTRNFIVVWIQRCNSWNFYVCFGVGTVQYAWIEWDIGLFLNLFMVFIRLFLNISERWSSQPRSLKHQKYKWLAKGCTKVLRSKYRLAVPSLFSRLLNDVILHGGTEKLSKRNWNYGIVFCIFWVYKR